MRGIHFWQDGITDTSLVGGKAASLAALSSAGFCVPNGFVITTEALSRLSDALERDIQQAFTLLGAAKVAVRSSAAAEDGTSASWAGQLETFLNIEAPSLMEHIHKCVASGRSERALSYAQRQGQPLSKVAVIVQAMVPSEVSGVAFSKHPVTGSDKHVVIEAGLGLGEAIVSGAITPDTYIIHKSSLEIQDRYISAQARQLNTDNKWITCGTRGTKQKLNNAQIVELTAVIHLLEAYWQHAVDAEWALVDNTFYITQSRPITT